MKAARESRICREVQVQLPALLTASLPRWRRRLVELHLHRCDRCRAELARQRTVTSGLRDLHGASATTTGGPPEGLLDSLLEVAERPGVRGRVAVPARGAVSGERPGLTVVLLVLGGLVGTAVGYAAWRGTHLVRGRWAQRGW